MNINLYMEMKKLIFGTMAAALLAMPATTMAQDSVEPEVSIDFLSHYMWRGTDKGGITIMPAAKLSWKGASVGLTGTTGIESKDPKEINIALGYKFGMFNVGITDYWTSGKDLMGNDVYFEWDSAKNGHQLEANFGVDFGFMTLQAYTIFWGNDFRYETLADTENRTNGKRAFSTYIEARFPFYWKGIDWDVCAGVTPFKSACYIESDGEMLHKNYFYADKPAIVMASVRATKRMEVGEVKTPIFAELHTNPFLKHANFLIGISIQPFK